MTIYGLIGKSLQHSFSQSYFLDRFKKNELKATYINFELKQIEEFPLLLKNIPELNGLNVTIPYKEVIIPFLDDLSPEARSIGAVNVIEFVNNQLIGHNTDWIGFKQSLVNEFDTNKIETAIILGTGGASKAVEFGLNDLGINTISVSSSGKTEYGYEHLEELLCKSELIVNCTPLGMHPNINEKPPIPYSEINSSHCLFDLVYNPKMTAFLIEGNLKGAKIKNGYDMLVGQAEAAWDIWNN